MPLDVRAGAASAAGSLERDERPLPVGTDLDALVRSEAERSRVLAAEPDVCVTVSGLDPKAWRVVRFTLRAEAPRGDEHPRRGAVRTVLHLARPGLSAAHSEIPA